jgi:hypothetical protein
MLLWKFGRGLLSEEFLFVIIVNELFSEMVEKCYLLAFDFLVLYWVDVVDQGSVLSRFYYSYESRA